MTEDSPKVGEPLCRSLELPGCFELCPVVHRDARGSFAKSFREDHFTRLGLRTDWREEFFTCSRADVIRGLHFQTPPAQHAKLVTCMAGAALDLLLDLRPGPGFGRWVTVELAGEMGNAVYVPEGVAHGFMTRVDGTILHYKVTSFHSPQHDHGVRWDSCGFSWPVKDPILSERDRAFPALGEFTTPFAS